VPGRLARGAMNVARAVGNAVFDSPEDGPGMYSLMVRPVYEHAVDASNWAYRALDAELRRRDRLYNDRMAVIAHEARWHLRNHQVNRAREDGYFQGLGIMMGAVPANGPAQDQAQNHGENLQGQLQLLEDQAAAGQQAAPPAIPVVVPLGAAAQGAPGAPGGAPAPAQPAVPNLDALFAELDAEFADLDQGAEPDDGNGENGDNEPVDFDNPQL